MSAGIIVPIVVIAVVVPAAFMGFRRYLASLSTATAERPPSGARLTTNALHRLPQPPWRVVHEIAPTALGGINHVLIGPGGIFAVVTEVSPLPPVPVGDDATQIIMEAAIGRGELDDALGRCAMQSSARVSVHWGRSEPDEVWRELAPGAIGVVGQRLDDWLATLPDDVLSPTQVDLAWHTVVTAIGRPDPLR
jgi:hypothetical protein